MERDWFSNNEGHTCFVFQLNTLLRSAEISKVIQALSCRRSTCHIHDYLGGLYWSYVTSDVRSGQRAWMLLFKTEFHCLAVPSSGLEFHHAYPHVSCSLFARPYRCWDSLPVSVDYNVLEMCKNRSCRLHPKLWSYLIDHISIYRRHYKYDICTVDLCLWLEPEPTARESMEWTNTSSTGLRLWRISVILARAHMHARTVVATVNKPFSL